MDQKTIISNVIVAVATAMLMGSLAWIAGVFEAGTSALNESQIEEVVSRILVMDSGKTYAATLNSIDKSVGEINVSLGAIKEDVDDLENAINILVAE